MARKGAGWYSRPGPESTGGEKSRADRGRLPAAWGRGRASERRDGKRGEAEEAVDEMQIQWRRGTNRGAGRGFRGRGGTMLKFPIF